MHIDSRIIQFGLLALLAMAVPDISSGLAPANTLMTIVKESGNWEMSCSSNDCLVVHEQLKGGNRRVVVELKRNEQQIDSFVFVVDGITDADGSFEAVFMSSQVDAKHPNCGSDGSATKSADCDSVEQAGHPPVIGSFKGSFITCQQGPCIAKVYGQYADDPESKKTVDLLDQFENADILVLLCKSKHGDLKHIAMDISGFTQAYQAALGALK